MKKYIILLTLLIIPIKVNGLYSYAVMDTDSGRLLGGENVDKTHLIASTTKVMTALVVLENSNTTDVLCAGEEISKVYGSMIYIEKDECMTVYDLLVGLLLRSGNDAAMVLSTNIMGYDNFINKMNSMARKLGMRNTIYENPHGLDDDSKNFSSAYDLALLMKYASNNKIFMEINKIKRYSTTSSNKTYIWFNKNKLLSSYKYATGGKIGYTTKSGHTFVSSSTKGYESIVIATIEDSDRFNTHKKLYEEYFKKYDSYNILDMNSFFIDIDYYKDYYLYIKEDVNVMLSKNELDKVDIKYNIIKRKNPKEGDILGIIKVYVNKELISSVNIYGKNIIDKKRSILDKLMFWK